MRNWLRKRKANAQPAIDDGQLPLKNVPIQISEEYLKSKRNLFWFCAGCILMFFSGINTCEDLMYAPSIGLGVDRRLLCLLFLICVLYSSFSFFHYKSRAIAINSRGAIKWSGGERSPKEAVEAVSGSLGEIQTALNKVEQLFGEIKRIEEEIKRSKDRISASFEMVVNLASKMKIEENKELSPSNFKSYSADGIDSHNSAVYELDNYFKELKTYLEITLRHEFELIKGDNSSPRIFKALERLSSLESSLQNLSEDIDKSDRFKFKYYDGWTANFLIGTSIVLTILQFSPSVMEFVRQLFDYIIGMPLADCDERINRMSLSSWR